MFRPKVMVYGSAGIAAAALAAECAALIRERQANGQQVVLGLATGGTPIRFYEELVRLHREEGLDFSTVTTFNLDEYLGLAPEHPESYRSFMRTHLFDHVNLNPAKTHLPPGIVEAGKEAEACAAYEQAIRDAGGIDFQILGIGRTGHIGFNEPGSPRDSRTRMVHLDPVTRQDATAAFGGLDHVPTHALTMGCATILDARALRLMAWGENKASIVREAVEGPVTDAVAASFLQLHGNARFLLDEGAASALGSPA
ncbi:MAG: glucosamine-6-phosphate deaminase [Verrucomicrobiales bacterium]